MGMWVEAGRGRPDWNAIFDGYASMVDYPGAAYWRELAAYYPDAKILHSVRDPEAWFESTQATIFSPHGKPAQAIASGAGLEADFFRSFTGPFADHLHDRAFLVDYFQRHTETVKATIPADRLLVYELGQGWGPLCEFLGVRVPDAPYPSENTRAEFIARTRNA
jgi:hypothetical protein